MRRNLTYPKDGERKLREDIKQLKMQVSRLRKENDMLRAEVGNVQKPARPRKEHKEHKEHKEQRNERPEKPDVDKELSRDEFRKEFSRKFKPTKVRNNNENEEQKD